MDTSNINENRPAAPGYEFLQVLGTGGTSTVWLARQVSLDRIVAIKVLDARLLENEEERERFRAEAQATAQLDLPALTRVLDFGEAEGMLYYVMEYIEGTSLAAWLKAHGRMSVVQALQVTDIIASAMGAAWDKAGLVHGDIKPGNILLGQDGSVKLTDLGLARLTARSLGRGGGAAPVADAATADATDGTWTLQGTPTYLAPEQVVGAAASVQSDIYSLGLTLYHLITGKVPFEGLGVDELLEAQQNDFLPDPCDVAGGKVPVGVALLLAKMTAKEPALRPDSWAALLADLEKVESGGKPSGPFPEETESTILLSPAHRPGVRGNTINLSAAGRKAILVTSTPRNSPAGGGDARSGSFAPPPSVQMGDGGNGFLKFLGFLAFLAALAGAVWLFVFRGHPDRWDTLKNSVASIGKSPGSQSGRGNQPGRPLQDVQKESGDTASADATSSAAPAQPTQAAKAADA
ncbi:MAG: serine/threonine protein kinase, partial [Kiritimatiellae bacterium]|nr:serine/threonine protein kinase [Kiritimatiellia bacterium]